MVSWRRFASISGVLALAIAAACSSFDAGSETHAVDGGPDSTADAPSDVARSDDAPADGGSALRVYVYGGYADPGGQVPVPDAWSAEILSAGALGPWTRAPELDTSRQYAANAVTSGRIVLAGGQHGLDGGDASGFDDPFSASVETASFFPLTKLTASVPVPGGRVAAAGATSGSWVYVSGGAADESTVRVDAYVTSFDTNGALLPWRSVASLPAALSAHGLVALGGDLYLAGGMTTSLTAVGNTWRGRVESDGTVGHWTETGSLPQPAWLHQLVAATGRLYAIGGLRDDGDATDSVSVGTRDPASGNVSWAPSNPLPAPLAAACAVVARDVIYVSGGSAANGGAPGTKVYAGVVGASGGIVWSETTALPGPRSAHACAAF